MNKFKFKVIIFALSFLIISFGLILFNKTNVYAHDNSNNSEEKIIKEIDIKSDFNVNSVIVVLKHSHSQYREISDNISNKLYSINEVISLEDLTEVPSDILINEKTLKTSTSSETIEHLNNIDFKQIIKINLNTNSKQEVINIIKQIELLDEVLYVGPNYIYSAETVTVDDTRFSEQWALTGLNGIDITDAWEFSTGTRDVRVGIIDSGIASHEDLNANVVTGFDYHNNNSTTNDDIGGHGTSVAGIIGAVGDNSMGISGINHEITLVPLQTAYNTSGTGRHNTEDIVEAIREARNLWDTENRISIINYSLSQFGYNTEVLAAIEQYQGLFIWSAGNQGENLDDIPGIEEFSLNNLISVGAHDNNNARSIWTSTRSSSYGNAVNIYAPGGRGTTQTNVNCLTTDSLTTSSYTYFNGTSCAAPHVSGVAALLLSLNENLTTNQLREAILQSAETITITVPDTSAWASAGDTVNQNVLKLNAYNAVKYVLEHFSNTEYTLSNYSSSVNTTKTIVSGDSYFNNKNGFYKLNVTYAKNYEFEISSNQNLNVILYDEDFNEISYADFDSSSNRSHFIQNLSVGTYYLRTQYENEEASGTINTKINSRTTIYLGYGENDILLNTYNDIVEYYYINDKVPGFYEFAIVGTKVDGTTVSLPANALKIYSDSAKTAPMDKFTGTDVSNTTQNKAGENSITTYLPRAGYFYLDIDVSSTDLKSLKLIVSAVESQDINLFELDENENSIISVLNNTDKGDYIETLNVEQTGKFTISYNYNGSLTDDFVFLLVKQNYNSTTNQYSFSIIINKTMNATNNSFTYTRNLEAGKYYVGYLNKNDVASMVVNFERLVTDSDNQKLLPDPDMFTVYGSEVRFNNGVCRGTNLTVGFTRFIYLDNTLDISSQSRLDYYWYSSDENIATISDFGTLLGLSPGTVKIMAVYKNDPSVVYVKQFTVLPDTRTEDLVVEISESITYAENGQIYEISLTDTNSPYPLNSLYEWSVVLDESSYSVTVTEWGTFSMNGTGTIVLEGRSKLNPHLVIRFTLIVT